MSAADIERIARAWVVREDKGPLPDGAQAELQAWLEADARHLGAYVRAKAAWDVLDRARVLGWREARAGSRRLGRRSAVAAACAGAMAAAAAVLVVATPATYASRLGETRRVRLPDGSAAVLDANTRIEARMGLWGFGERRVRVVQGEAWFQVVHDRRHPFVVRAGPAEVKAVGTAFAVSRAAGRTDVVVTEGVVEARARGLVRPVRVAAGDKATLGEDRARLVTLSAAAVDTELAWREGRIGLDGDPLSQAVGRFNRFNKRQLVLASPELGEVSVVGWFRLDDPESFARAVAVGLKARIEIAGDSIVIRGPAEKN